MFQVETEYFPFSGRSTSERAVSGRRTFDRLSTDLASSAFAAPSRLSARKTKTIRHVERYWLCDVCCASMTLIFGNEGVATVPLLGAVKKSAASHAAASDQVRPWPSWPMQMQGRIGAGQ
jgi:hypothetical protein